MSILFQIAGFILTAATLPLVLELLLVTSAGLLPQRRKQRAHGHGTSRLAVIVPAHNEELSIGSCVASLCASAVPGTRIYVIAHNCTDATAKVAHDAGAEVLVCNDPAAKGKGHVLLYGFEYATRNGAEAVLVVDADSTVSINLIPSVLSAFSEGAEAVQCRYEMGGATGKIKTELSSLAVRGFNFIRPLGRERLGLSAGILGNGFAVATTILREVPYQALSVVEDLEYHLHLVLAGRRVRFVSDAVVSSELAVSKAGETVQHSRWEGGRLRVARAWLLPLFKEALRGRKAALEPMLDLAGLPIAFAVMALLLAFALPVEWTRLYAALAMVVIFAHVLAAVFSGPRPFRTLGLLFMAPVYLLWKLRLVPSVLRASSARAAWVRTNRETAVAKTTVRSAS